MKKTPFVYEDEALKTLSNQFHAEKLTLFELEGALEHCASCLNDLDFMKKAVFYGKGERLVPATTLHVLRASIDNMELANGEHLIHGIIGVATEAGELLEALLTCIQERTPIDKVNLKEEIGDVFWYLAVLAKACGTNFDEIQRTNIAKLRARFPNDFSEHDAIERNLETERAILEGKQGEDC